METKIEARAKSRVRRCARQTGTERTTWHQDFKNTVEKLVAVSLRPRARLQRRLENDAQLKMRSVLS